MGIKNLPMEEWIEVDKELGWYYMLRKRRMDTRGEKVVSVLSERNVSVVGGCDGEGVGEGERMVKIPGAEVAGVSVLNGKIEC